MKFHVARPPRGDAWNQEAGGAQGWGAASARLRVALQELCALGLQPVASPWGRARTWSPPHAVTKLACAFCEGSVDPRPQCP